VKTNNTIISNVLVALALLLGAGAAQAATVICGTGECGPGDTNATGISNLELDAVLYDVEFVFDFGGDIFTIPLRFPTSELALAATSAVSDALNTESLVTTVGPQMSNFYDIPFEFELETGWSVRSADYFLIAGGWQPDLGNAGLVPEATPSSFAVFTSVPEPSMSLLTVAALATLGVVRRWRREGSEGTA
jgi:hypothetical protein